MNNSLTKARYKWCDIPVKTRTLIKRHCKKRAQLGDGFLDIIKSVAGTAWKGIKKVAPTVWNDILKPVVLPILKKEAEKRIKAKFSGSGLNPTGGALTLKGNGLRLSGARRGKGCCKKKGGALTLTGKGKKKTGRKCKVGCKCGRHNRKKKK